MTSRQPVKVGICGLGTVGSGVFRLLRQNKSTITTRLGRPIEIVCLGMRSPKPHLDTGSIRVCQDIMDVARDPAVDILVETIGGEKVARMLALEAMAQGKHIVTANKALIAIHGQELFTFAEQHGIKLHFEASVAGGIPIIKVMREGLIANQISLLRGIVNGTTNYVLSAMADEGRDFQEVLLEAQELGYAEKDPSLDIEGIDSAHKLAILATLAFDIPLCFDQIYKEGIAQISQQDMLNAEQLGLHIKHIAIARAQEAGYELRVHPALLPKRNLLTHVKNVLNAIEVQGDAVDRTFYSGAGAGADATASAIIADIADIIGCTADKTSGYISRLAQQNRATASAPVLPMANIVNKHYVRLNARNEPGVFEQLTQIFKVENINIETLIQDAHQNAKPIGPDQIPTFILTYKVKEAAITNALKAIRNLKNIYSDVQHIRVEDS